MNITGSCLALPIGGRRVKLVIYRKIRDICLAVSVITATGFGATTGLHAEPFIGQIMITGSSFCPRGWVEANGQLANIASNSALFSLYGTMYGGDGRTTFGLPDLRGRTPIHKGQAPGLRPRSMGEKGGSSQVNAASGNTAIAVGPPYLTLLYCIAISGVYPSRS